MTSGNHTAAGTESNNTLKVLVFFASLGVMVVIVTLLYAYSSTWRAMLQDKDSPLRLVINGFVSIAVALVTAILVPGRKAQEAAKTPDEPVDKSLPEPQEPMVSLELYLEATKEREAWRTYGQHMQDYAKALEEARKQMDTRQAVLRVSLYSMVALGVAFALAGFLAPPLNLYTGDVPPAVFLQHMRYLGCAFLTVGAVTGVVVHRIRARTTPHNAVKCALVASLVLSLASFLIALPYVAKLAWNMPLQLGSAKLPILIWMLIFRLIAFPLVCALSAYVASKVLEKLAKQDDDKPATQGGS